VSGTASVLIYGAPTLSRARVAAVALPPGATNSAGVATTFEQLSRARTPLGALSPSFA
jgi:hypothetical protein